jgi:flagellar motor protein MotB
MRSALRSSVALLALPIVLSGCAATQIRQLQTDKEMLQTRIMALQQDLGASREQAQMAATEREACRAELDNQRQRYDALYKRFETSQLALQTASNSQAREVAQRIETALAAEQVLREEAETLRARIATLEQEILHRDNELASVRRDLESADDQAEKDTELLRQVRDALEKQGASLEQQTAEVTRLSRELSERTAALAAMDSRRGQLEAELKGAQDTIAARTKELEEASAQLAARNEEIKTLSAKAATDVAEAATKGPDMTPLRDEIAKALRPAISAGRARVVTGDGAVRVILASDALFRPATTQLSDDGQKLLQEILTGITSVQGWSRLQIEGHTDNTPIISMPYPDNWELASARANEVLRWLAPKLPTGRNSVSTISHGDRLPLQDNRTADGRRANRRVEIRLLP